ncbi:hypothetical protein J6590_104663 [Homalodisca vitripennis]|nr:hypothetical protein J6590_104663 [Homalodisca vitripennis]
MASHTHDGFSCRHFRSWLPDTSRDVTVGFEGTSEQKLRPRNFELTRPLWFDGRFALKIT